MNAATKQEGSDKVIIEGILIPTRSIKAVLVALPDEKTGEIKNEWIPLSQISKEVRVSIDPQNGEELYRYYIPRWLAEAKKVAYIEEDEGDERDSREIAEDELQKELDFNDDIPF